MSLTHIDVIHSSIYRDTYSLYIIFVVTSRVKVYSGRGPFRFDCTVLNGFTLSEHNNGSQLKGHYFSK